MSAVAENAVLGAAMTSPRACAVVCDLLASDDFERHAARELFGAIAELHEGGAPVDMPSVTDLLIRRGQLETVGGPAALADLTGQVAAAGAVEYHCAAVLDAADRRRAKDAAARFADEVDSTDDLSRTVDALTADLTARRGVGGTVDPADVRNDLRARLAGEGVEAWSTGWGRLDNLFRFPAGMLTTVTGLPSSGKSTWLDVAIWQVCKTNPDVKVTFFSPEQGPPGKHLLSLVHTSLGADPMQGRPGLAERIDEQTDWWLERVSWIDDVRDNSPSQVLSLARREAAKGMRILVIDPYNNLSPDGNARGDRQDLYIQDLLRRVKRFARDTGTAVVLVAHPRQPQVVPGTEAVFQVPTAAHIAGGQEWWNHSDAIVTVWRNQSGEDPEQYGWPEDVRIVVQKVRDTGRWGRQGAVTLRFDEPERRYRETRA